MRVRALVATVLAVSLFGGASTASAIHVFVCHDKEAPRPILCPRGCLPTQPVFCDADHQCNGVCTFVVRVCSPEVVCSDETFVVPVGQKVIVPAVARVGRALLRCRRGRICPLPHPCGSADCPPCSRTNLCHCVDGTCQVFLETDQGAGATRSRW